MDNKVNCILLIDDNKIDNFFHTRVINKYGVATHIIVKDSAEEGLEYLRNKEINKGLKPDIIFLDINMPGMNGWEFIDEYSLLEKELQSSIVVVMLSTSDNPDDIALARTKTILADFKTKPLTKEKLNDVILKIR